MISVILCLDVYLSISLYPSVFLFSGPSGCVSQLGSNRLILDLATWAGLGDAESVSPVYTCKRLLTHLPDALGTCFGGGPLEPEDVLETCRR